MIKYENVGYNQNISLDTVDMPLYFYLELNNSCNQDTCINQHNVQNIGQGGGPHAADEGNADKGNSADDHAALEVKDIR